MSETIEVQIPEEVEELLNPITKSEPCGTDITNDQDYFKLSMEIGKTVPDYKVCADLGVDLLKEKSKDLWVASWLCFSWFRIEKMVGVRNGLCLLYNLLTKFEEKLFPTKINHRAKAIQYLNSSRFFKLLEKVDIDKSNAELVTEIAYTFKNMLEECNKQFGENAPVLNSVKQVIEDQLEKAQKILLLPKQEEKPEVKETTEKKEQVVQKTEEKKEDVKTETPKEVAQPKPTVAEIKPVASSKDAVEEIKNNLIFFFDNKGANQEPPSGAFIYGLSRTLQWKRLSIPANNDNVTQIVQPNQNIQNGLKQVLMNKQWDRLINGIEKNFLIDDSGFMYWLDIQRYVSNALEMKGGEFLQAAEEIKFQLAKLIYRIPNIYKLKFNDGKTVFADNETIEWIKKEVNTLFEKNGTKKSQILPPIMSEEYEVINKEYKSACNELPDKFEENFSKIQKNIEGDTRRKGRFLRTLNLANYCIESENFQLAKIYLSDLESKIEEYNLVEWEPALCVAVWQSQYIINSNSNINEDNIKLLSEKEKLFQKIAKYNGILAMKLNDHIKQQGE